MKLRINRAWAPPWLNRGIFRDRSTRTIYICPSIRLSIVVKYPPLVGLFR